MGTQGTQLQPEAVEPAPPTQPWGITTRVAFRFCFVYFGLYCLLTQIVTDLFSPTKDDIPDPSTLWPLRQLVVWTAVHIFRVTKPLAYNSGSGDKTFGWVLLFACW